ncbi:hypothetical protein GTY65_02980 [Streptomyces sp. SID8379]|uniref:hypothetical protein n=1 Tax=unclassified Streptomyces TaxID=2593676 RepID=UPI0003819B9A|nr:MULTISPECIES: hypothetical protein [unclassified Streptomyces]MYW63047.1 hypothetical protein [Streptomyces sp. SID8379]
MPAASQTRHPSPGDLALIAVDGDAPPPAEEHLRVCAPCRTMLDSFLRVLEAGRAGTADPVRPPDDVWDTIRDQL